MESPGALPPRPGEHPPSERGAEIGLPSDEPAPQPPPREEEPKQTPHMSLGIGKPTA